MAMVTAMGNCAVMAMATATESKTATEMATAMAMVMATARATIPKEGLPLHVAAMCSAFRGATPCLHPHRHKQKCVHHGGDTAKRVCSPSRGRVPDSSPWIVFCLFFTTTVQFTEQPSVRPPTLFRLSRTLSADCCSTSSTPPRTTSAY